MPGTLPISGSYKREAMVSMMQGMAQRFATPVAFEVTGMVGEGDKVAVECRSEIDTVDGRQYRNRYHMLFQIADDRIARLVEYCDTKHVHEVFLV